MLPSTIVIVLTEIGRFRMLLTQYGVFSPLKIHYQLIFFLTCVSVGKVTSMYVSAK